MQAVFLGKIAKSHLPSPICQAPFDHMAPDSSQSPSQPPAGNPADDRISVGGDVNNSVLIAGSHNNVNINNLPEPKPVLTGQKSNVSGGGSQTFVGREEALTDLHERLCQGGAVAITAIRGMGGIGKTELARQYAKRYGADYTGGVCWLQARELDVASQIVEFAQVYLQLVPPEELELAAQVAYCWAHWPGTESVLVVMDDVTEYDRVAEALPPETGRFVVLMTTRRQGLAVGVSDFEIELLSEESALALLRQLVGEARTAAELEVAKEICDWVGYLPLGLELVGQYLKAKQDVTFSKLLGRLEEQRTEARALQKAYPGMTAKLGVIDAFELSWQTLCEDEQKIACWLSLFALAPIPWEIAAAGVEAAEEEDWEDGRDGLVTRSLLKRVEVSSYQLHQLVREYFLAKLAQREAADDVRRAYCQQMVALAKQIPYSPTRELLLRLTPVMPHIAEVTTSWQRWLSDEDNELACSLGAMARFYEGQGAYAQAEPWYAKCLTATKERFGEDHPDVASSLNNLADLYYSQGRYEEAEPLFVQALELRRKLLGEDHPDVASSLNNLAGLYESQGRYEEAEPLYVQALALSRKLLGEDNPYVATSLNNLALLYKSQGRYEEAEPLYVQALELRRKLLGEDHPDVATSLNNLAGLYKRQGRYEKAEPLFVQGLGLSRKLLGEDHPDVATSLNNLAGLYKSQGRYEEAEPLYVQALALSRKLLGEDHPYVASSLNNLALLYESQGRYEEAEPLYVQGVGLMRKLLGEDHPYVATSLNNLAGLYESQGRYEEAEPLCVQAIAILSDRLGQDHPNTRAGINNFVQLIAAAIAANRQGDLSDNPMTQAIIKIVQSQPPQP